jgi:hypothetical protein
MGIHRETRTALRDVVRVLGLEDISRVERRHCGAAIGVECTGERVPDRGRRRAWNAVVVRGGNTVGTLKQLAIKRPIIVPNISTAEAVLMPHDPCDSIPTLDGTFFVAVLGEV